MPGAERGGVLAGSARLDHGGIVKAFVFALLRYSGATFLVRHTVQSRRVTVLAYHDPKPAVFDEHLARLTSLYSIISLQDFSLARRSNDWRGLPKRPLLVTLDDGWAHNLELLPVLERHRVRPVVFVTTSLVGTHRHYWWTHASDPEERERLKQLGDNERLERLESSGYTPATEYPTRQALSTDELRVMSARVDIQAHSRSHPILPRCSDENALSEIAGSAADLEQLTGTRPTAFAYPNGDYSERDTHLVQRAGYECAFTIDPGYNGKATDPYRLKRIVVGDDANPTELVVRASGMFGILASAARRLFSAAGG
jgi:peptidoglycan/xylan/chitin deacetylase (PgdA/CDA1 family)